MRGVPEDSNDVVLIEAILAIARHHHINVVAEGVETSEQFDFLSNHGCQCFQGHFFRRPVPAADLLSEILLEVAEERTGVQSPEVCAWPRQNVGEESGLSTFGCLAANATAE